MSKQSFSLTREAVANPAFFAFIMELRRALRGCQTVLDLGCGDNSPARFLDVPHLTGVDGYAPSVEAARKRGTHDEVLLADVRDPAAIFAGRKFDACIALDVIEHLPKADGWRMLEGMERLAQQQVVIFTPNGFVPQQSKNGDLQEHLSGWDPAEMRARGYEVLGMHGPKELRGEYAALVRRPKVFWSLYSVAMHYLKTRQKPEAAFSIFCRKSLR